MLPALLLLLPRASAAGGTSAPVDARFALALYCNPTCDDSVLDGLEADLSTIPAVDGFDDPATAPGRLMGLADTTASPYGKDSGFETPDADFLAAYGVDVDRPEELAASQSVVLAWFVAPRDQALQTLQTAQSAFANAAKAGNGWVEDLDTQAVYGQAAWAARQPNGPLTDWFIIEDSPGDDAAPTDLRLVTRGLRRMADRELVLDNVPAESAGDAAYVIDAVALALHNRDDLPSTLLLDGPEARGTATLVEVPVQSGDPESPLVAISFKGQVLTDAEISAARPAPDAAPPEARPPEPAQAVAEARPPEPAAAAAPATLAEAQSAARSRLDSVVRTAFAAGLPAGDRIAVSVPFPNPDGTREYLWVEVQEWQGSILRGIVATPPSKTRAVQKGQAVTIDQAQVYDYVWKKADGSREGNTTAAFLASGG